MAVEPGLKEEAENNEERSTASRKISKAWKAVQTGAREFALKPVDCKDVQQNCVAVFLDRDLPG